MAAGRSVGQCGRILCAALLMVLAVAAAGQGKCQTTDGQTLFQVLQRMPDISVFTSLIRQAKIIPIFNEKNKQFTIFAPLDYAFGNILPKGKGFFDLIPEEEIAKTIVNFHMAVPAVPGPKLAAGLNLTSGLKSPKGKFIPLSIDSQLDPLKPFTVAGPLNQANISKPLGTIACNSVIYKIDEVLLPSEKIFVTPKNSADDALEESFAFELLVTPRPPGAKPPPATVLPGRAAAAATAVDEDEEEADAEDADADAEEAEDEEAVAAEDEDEEPAEEDDKKTAAAKKTTTKPKLASKAPKTKTSGN